MVAQSLWRLTKFVKAWDLVVGEVREAPETLSQYMHQYERVVRLLAEGDSYRLRGEYLAAWTARGYLQELVYGKGHMEVVVDEGASLERFVRVNPDRHDNLRRMQRYVMKGHGKDSSATVRQFIDRALGGVAQSCNVMSCSMWLCFGDDRGFRERDFAKSVESWRAAAQVFYREHGLMPHPVLVAQSLRQ